MQRSTFAVCALLLAAPCSGQQSSSADQRREELRKKADEARERNAREREEIQKNFQSPSAAGAPTSHPTENQICRAAIAALMGRVPTSIAVTGKYQDAIHTRYTRPSDRTVWENRCRVVGDVVQWATMSGPWRTRPGDELITFLLAPTQEIVIKIGNADGSFNLYPFALSALGDA
jgi:hypothetical protein